ncbi:MAG: hypothetical protein U1E52_07325 [Geminicoccaceae bacterium]
MDRFIVGIVGVLAQIDINPGARAPGAAGLHGDLPGSQRIVEVTRADGELEAAAANRCSPLEFVDTEPHARLGGLAERALDAVAGDQLAQIVKVDPRMREQASVDAIGSLEYRTLEQIQEALGAGLHVRPEPRFGTGRIDTVFEEPSQIPGQAQRKVGLV